MSSIGQDLRHAVRGFLNRPTMLTAAVLSMGVGLGMTSVLFGIVDDLLFRPPAHVRAPAEIIRLYYSQPTSLSVSPWASFPTYELLRDHVTALSGLAAEAPKTVVIGRGEHAREVAAAFVTVNFFSLLGTAPALGRFFSEDEETTLPPSTLVIGHGLWQSAFAKSTDVLGSSVYIGNRAFTVVGVAPAGFSGIDQARIDVWLPIGAASELVDATALTSPTLYWVSLFGRLARAPADQASHEATAILRSSRPVDLQDSEVKVVLGPVLSDRGPGRSSGARLSIWLAAASAMLLLIGCANIASLMLLRFVSRTPEFATRAALGASKGQLIRHVVLDVGFVTVIGGLLAVGVVQWVGGAARALLAPDLNLAESDLDLRAVWQIGMLTVLAGAVCALPPIVFVATRRFAMNPGVQSGVRSPFRRATGAALVAVQCAVSVILLVGAGLFSRSLKNVTNIDLGLDTEHVLYASADLRTNLSRADALALYEKLSDGVRVIPGVEMATVAMGLPLRKVWAVATNLQDGIWSGPNPIVLGHAVGPDYFAITGLRITRGRPFEPSDHTPKPRVAVINEAFAHAFWPIESPLGECLHLGSDSYCTHVVGVAVNTPRWSITADREYELYVPIDHGPQGLGTKGTLALAIRAGTDPAGLILPIRRSIQSASPDISYASVTPVGVLLAPQLRPWRLATTVFTSFAFVAVILAGVGLYGLLAFLVDRERQTIGIRMALGASPSVIWRSVVARGTTLCGLGTAIGLMGSEILAPLGHSLVFGVSVHDRLVFVGSAAVVVVMSIAASYLPARRAAKLDAAALLRSV